MISAVRVAGVELDLFDVFASLTIRHGRGSVDDGPLGSTATLSLVNVDRDFVRPFRVGVELELELVGGAPRFVGRITDAELDSEAATLALLAVSTLARISDRPVGADGFPAETWSDRVARVFAEADASALLELELGATDPALAARDPDETELGTYLASLAETVPAAIADLPDGRVLVQAVATRQGRPPVPLSPELVAYAPEWAQTDDVRNTVRVEWDGGTIEQSDAVSAGLFGERAPLVLRTELSGVGAAATRALLELNRRAYPEWTLERAELLELEPALGVGAPVRLSELPPASPFAETIRLLEGWEDRVEPDGVGGLEWTMVLSLSPPALSGYGAAWAAIDPALRWMDVDPALTWPDAEELLYA